MLLLLVCACQKEEPSITLSETEIDAVYTAGEVSITIEPNVSWTAEVHYNDWREEKWIELPVTSGLEGPQRFVIRLPENPTRIREAKVYFHLAGTQELTILLVKQIGKLDRDMTDQLDIYTAAAMMLAHPPLGYISYEDIVKCKSLTYENINESMDCWGLALLENLVSVSVRNCNIPSLGFKAAPWLKNLYFTDSTLGSLDISGNTALEDLRFKDTSIRSLDASKNPNLQWIDFEYSNLTPDLETLSLGPGLIAFVLSNARSLSVLDCSQASGMSILELRRCSVHRFDLANTSVWSVEINDNPVDELTLPPTLRQLNLLHCKGNLSSVTVNEGANKIVISDTAVREVNVDSARSLSSLECSYSLLKRLDISKISLPSRLNVDGNPGVDGVFEIIVSPDDFESAKAMIDGRCWNLEDGSEVVARVVSGGGGELPGGGVL